MGHLFRIFVLDRLETEGHALMKRCVTDRCVVDLKSRLSGGLLHFYQFEAINDRKSKLTTQLFGLQKVVLQDKITTTIVKTANTRPIGGVGVGGAIRRAGGTDITVGGNLTTRYIIQTAGSIIDLATGFLTQHNQISEVRFILLGEIGFAVY